MRSILIISGDPFLAGIYGRKFERDGWAVGIAESVEQAKMQIAKFQSNIVLIETSCTNNVPALIRELKSLPTMQRTKIVILSKESNRDAIQNARNAGADQYLILGHFIPHEAVEKMRDLIKSNDII